MNVILLGPAGTGKGTQTRRICEHFGWTRVASGELLRAAATAGTPDGLAAKRYMDAGELVPDALTLRLVLGRMAHPDSRKGVVLDGFPRTVAQATALDDALATRGEQIDVAVLLEVGPEELLHRLAGRLTCRRCGATYHPVLQAPREAGVCDRCEGDLYVRDDDREEVVRARNAVYEQETAPMVRYYAGRQRLRRENGVGAIDEVWERVRHALTSFAAAQAPDVAGHGKGGLG